MTDERDDLTSVPLAHLMPTDVPEPDESQIPGLKPFTMSGHFTTDTRPVCPLCGLKFAWSTSGLVPVAVVGDARVPICDACAVHHLTESPPSSL